MYTIFQHAIQLSLCENRGADVSLMISAGILKWWKFLFRIDRLYRDKGIRDLYFFPLSFVSTVSVDCCVWCRHLSVYG